MTGESVCLVAVGRGVTEESVPVVVVGRGVARESVSVVVVGRGVTGESRPRLVCIDVNASTSSRWNRATR